MRIIGIDPGLATVGYGIVDVQGERLRAVQYGTITTPAHRPYGERLKEIYDGLQQLLERYRPVVMAVEKLFFNTNVSTALTVGAARGVLVLVGVQHQLDIAEYTPMQVKQAMTGYGHADKKQMQEMVRLFLHLAETPKPDDAADALAIAVCHAHSRKMRSIEGKVSP